MRISLSITHLLSIRIGHLRTPIVQCLTGHGKFQEFSVMLKMMHDGEYNSCKEDKTRYMNCSIVPDIFHKTIIEYPEFFHIRKVVGSPLGAFYTGVIQIWYQLVAF